MKQLFFMNRFCRWWLYQWIVWSHLGCSILLLPYQIFMFLGKIWYKYRRPFIFELLNEYLVAFHVICLSWEIIWFILSSNYITVKIWLNLESPLSQVGCCFEYLYTKLISFIKNILCMHKEKPPRVVKGYASLEFDTIALKNCFVLVIIWYLCTLFLLLGPITIYSTLRRKTPRNCLVNSFFFMFARFVINSEIIHGSVSCFFLR